MLTALMLIKEYGTRVHTQLQCAWWRAVCAKATNNQLLTELKSTFLLRKKKKESDFKAYNNQTSLRRYHTYKMCYNKYKGKCLQHVPGHTFGKKEEKIIHSIFGSLPPLSLYAPLPFPLYRCGYLISTIDEKFLFLIMIVLCCAKSEAPCW